MSEKFTIKRDPDYPHVYLVYLGGYLVGRVCQEHHMVIGEAFIKGERQRAYDSYQENGLYDDASRDHCLNEACKSIRRILEERGGLEERVFEFGEGPL